MEKKVGFIFMGLSPLPEDSSKARSVNEFVFKANVGTKLSERRHKEVRIYESGPGGRLLSFTVEQRGDGGEQTLEGTATKEGLRIIRRRPGHPDQTLTLPPSKETVEDADPARVALHRRKPYEGTSLDGTDLESYRVSTTLGETSSRIVGGVPVKLRKAVSLSEKEKVPIESYLDEKGRVLEINFGSTMRAVAEPEAVARRLDQVEVFGLTRVVLPGPVPSAAQAIPGKLVLVASGLPEKFHRPTYRQSFRALPDGKVEVSITARPPSRKPSSRPLADPSGGSYLKSTIIVESDHQEIRSLSEEILSGEKDAYAAAKKIVRWVNQNLTKDYGASADRATDVLRQRRGDCTEHSLLSVALLRAAGIPARRVDGVVYMVNEDNVPALYWHEWVEAFVGEWTQLDPTFGQDVADATHLAVGEEGNAEITPLIGQLKVVELR
ncbi:MAG: transglutaminase domain-containing protein [Myxococcales bacterium]|nr:transglutaminase domain-containing protein [Myxococcales bacterium]